jgi:energy-converting hydrogenase Eha subunit H
MQTTPKPNNFLSGMEEAVARFLSLIVSLIFFSINLLSKTPQQIELDWKNLMIYLGIFWLVYEFCAFFLFLVLIQFSKNKNLQNELNKANLESKDEKQTIVTPEILTNQTENLEIQSKENETETIPTVETSTKPEDKPKI